MNLHRTAAFLGGVLRIELSITRSNVYKVAQEPGRASAPSRTGNARFY
jgi:hypothetical protein